MNEKLKMHRVLFSVLALTFATAFCVFGQNSVSVGQPGAPVTILDSTRQQDGLIGSVRRVKTQSAKLEMKSGQLAEGPLQLLEVTTYSLSGQRIENVSYPIASSPVGKEEYKYDQKGNIVEMTLRGADGSILSREAYDYEFDRLGNWKKMVTNLVLFEGGELKREPVEVTYRTLTYYFDDAVASLVDHRSTPAASVPAVTNLKVRGDYAIEPLSTAVANNSSVPFAGALLNDSPPVAPPLAAVKTPPVVTVKAPPVVTVKKDDLASRTVAPKASSERPALLTANSSSSTPAGEAVANNASASPVRKDKLAQQFYQDGRQRFDSGDFAAAIVAYQQSLQIEPQSAEVNVSLGHAFYRLKKPEESARAFKQAIALNPKIAEAYYGLGLDYFGLKRNKDAADAFKRATVLKPDMAKAHYGLALAYQEMGKEAELIEQYRILQTLDRALAQKLAASFPEFNLPCRAAPFCK